MGRSSRLNCFTLYKSWAGAEIGEDEWDEAPQSSENQLSAAAYY